MQTITKEKPPALKPPQLQRRYLWKDIWREWQLYALLILPLGYFIVFKYIPMLVLPGAISAFYLIIIKTFFSSIPVELEESAKMDGASHIRVLWSIILPLSLPSLATLSLFYAVGRWNGFQDALIYITSQHLYPIQLKLYAMVISGQATDLAIMEAQNVAAPVPESLKAASIMFGTVPILLVYPWLQRYFISGMMIGAVKG